MELDDKNDGSVDPRPILAPSWLLRRQILEDRFEIDDFKIVNGVCVQVVAQNMANPILSVIHPAQIEIIHPKVVPSVQVVMGRYYRPR